MAKVLGDVIRLGSHEHVYCSALQFAFRYKVLTSERRDERVFPAAGSGAFGSESEGSQSVDLQPMYEIETTASHCTRSAGNHQQTTAAKRSTHTSVVGMAIHF